MKNLTTTPSSRALAGFAIFSAACFAAAGPTALHGQITADFESFTTGAFASNGDWTINDNDFDQVPRSAEILSTGLSFSNSAYTINGGNRSLQLNLTDSTNTSDDPVNDFAIFDFSSTPLGGDGSTVEFRYLFQAPATGQSFLNIGVSGNASADRPSRTSSAALTIRSVEQARLSNNLGISTTADTGLDSSDGATHLVIGQVTFNASGDEIFNLWIDPDSVNLGSLTPSASVTAEMGTTSLEAWGFFPNGSSNESLIVDEFQASVIAVPEPAAYTALFGLSALGFGLLKRRRNRD